MNRTFFVTYMKELISGMIIIILEVPHMNADMELYNKKFGTEAQLYNTKVKYVYNQNGKKTFVESTLILSRRHIVIISNKEHFFKEIIIRNIKGYTLSDKFMSAVVELIYGNNQFEFNATIAFKNKKEREIVLNFLSVLFDNNFLKNKLQNKTDR